jgi:hypothetical protein
LPQRQEISTAVAAANAQVVPTTIVHGNITSAIKHKPFGGEAIGTYAIIVSGQKVEVKISLQRLSESGDIFEARFVDTNINSTLSLGRVCTNSILPINQSIMSLFPYDQIIITNPKEV